MCRLESKFGSSDQPCLKKLYGIPTPTGRDEVLELIGTASIFYFLGLQSLPVSVAAASSNAYIVVTVALSTIFLRQPLTRPVGCMWR